MIKGNVGKNVGFFDEMTESSFVKSKIVSDYFGAWSTVMKSHAKSERLAYVDLFAGPGRYACGTKSTPVKVMEKIISDEKLVNKMVTFFNDINPEFCDSLRQEIECIVGFNNLKFKPKFFNTMVGDELVDYFARTSLVPTLAFIDPWGYKGLSSKLIEALIKDWGSDCIFYFNYNRINMGITNPSVVEHMNSIFGEERADKLRGIVKKMNSTDREMLILNELAESLTNNNKNFVLPFRFIREDGYRTSHYLILVSKHVLGYGIMKQIMHRCSSEYNDGVASFSYIPVLDKQLSILSLYDRPLDTLGEELLSKFKGQCLSVKSIYDRHHVNTPFILINYKEALRRLESENRVKVQPPANKRRSIKGQLSMGDNVMITFK